MQTKKTPMRMCCGCGEMKPKKELKRIVRTPEGEIVLDLIGKVSGRGAYICPSAECLKKAKKSGRISRTLASEISEDIYSSIEKEMQGIE